MKKTKIHRVLSKDTFKQDEAIGSVNKLNELLQSGWLIHDYIVVGDVVDYILEEDANYNLSSLIEFMGKAIKTHESQGHKPKKIFMDVYSYDELTNSKNNIEKFNDVKLSTDASLSKYSFRIEV